MQPPAVEHRYQGRRLRFEIPGVLQKDNGNLVAWSSAMAVVANKKWDVWGQAPGQVVWSNLRPLRTYCLSTIQAKKHATLPAETQTAAVKRLCLRAAMAASCLA